MAGMIFTMLSILQAQTVNYTITKDDPSKPGDLIVNLDLLQMDFFAPFASSSLNLGIWGYYEFAGIGGLDYTFRRSYLLFSQFEDRNAKPNVDLEIGGHYQLLGKTLGKKKKARISLKQQGDITYYITPEATRYRKLDVRGGAIVKRNVVENPLTDAYIPYNNKGIYAGLSSTGYFNILIHAEGFGNRSNSGGSQVFLDLLLMPANGAGALLNNNLPIGWRGGWRVFGAFPKSESGKGSGFAADIQLGMRPYTGFYILTSVGFTIAKKSF